MAVLSLLLVTPLSAAELTLTLDPAATTISFEVDATMHTVRGTARLREGVVRFDSETGEATGRIVVDASTLDTGDAKRDRKMHADVIESTAFSEIWFAPHAARGAVAAGEALVAVGGTFGLRGDEHDITLEVETRVDGGTLRLVTEFEVPYVAWGLNDPSRFVLRVGKTVRVRIESTGSLAEVAGGED